MQIAIMIVVVLGAVGLFFGLVLAVANKKLGIKVNPLIEEVEEILPKGQCGSCGFAGCAAYAEAVVLNPEVSPSLCIPGKEAVAAKVAELTGKTPSKIEPRIARVRCSGGTGKAVVAYNYIGIQDCSAANLLNGGPKGCQYGCLGLGTCVKSCPFGALSMGENGLPVVDEKVCTGCAACEAACPKGVIKMMPLDSKVVVSCSSKDKGAAAKKLCSSACIGCGLCAKACPHGAIKLENNLAVVDKTICAAQCTEITCTAKCPTGAISAVVQ